MKDEDFKDKELTEDIIEKRLRELLEKPKEFIPKPASCFRNNYKNFQYDYEEDPYETN
ncbi:MAG: hypothetical protein ACRDA4_04275 [Filifactoraceae bacterium]